ncbi:class I SAM-dependent DNA methyltransferase [Demetria terragena]|uniref:class I SAM-dependent DNA methyltransferase n=1 Tax=Demetria terragena TaxID=63959 RepID=UPI0004755C45|nr:class I SAM-dependent methyltransferase [Demetria terragena]
MTSSDLWTHEMAARYDDAMAKISTPDAVKPAVDLLAELADGGPVCEFAIGTGRIGIPLSRRGLSVTGIELSEPMVQELHRKDPDLPVTIGDMATTAVGDDFALVYLVFNTIGNLRTQPEQVACFANAAAHLRPGGSFVVEVGVPQLQRLPPGQTAIPSDISEEHVGLDTYDLVTQQATSHHYNQQPDGSYRFAPHHYRYVWPSELDLMAQLAGMNFEARYADWGRSPFVATSDSHVSIWRKGSALT